MELKEVKKELKRFKDVASVANTDGGKVLIKSLKKDVLSGLETVLSIYKGEEIELRTSIAKLKSDLDLLRVLLRAPRNAKIVEEELTTLLSEGLEEEE